MRKSSGCEANENSNYQSLNLPFWNLKITNRHNFQYYFDAHVTSINREFNRPLCCVGVIHLQISGLSHFPYNSLYQSQEIIPIHTVAITTN